MKIESRWNLSDGKIRNERTIAKGTKDKPNFFFSQKSLKSSMNRATQ